MASIQLSQPKRLSKWITVALPIALSVTSMGLLTRPALAQEEPMVRMLTVTGQGTESISATLAQIQLGVEVQGNTASEVQRAIADRSAAVIAYLQSQDVDKLQTTGVYLYPQYDYSENGNQRIIGYTASNTVSFRIDTDEAGVVMDNAVDAGATRIDGISFVADDGAIATAQRDALREATDDALSQADVVLQALGLSRDEVVGIQINNSATYVPPIPYAAMAEDRFASTPVIAGEQDVTATVTLQISY
ncbi:MAG: SIMPL domain-containing protein [Synechococcales cyanobacterium T60_A2020_003]|nr:SIMPL domain-containing protein [Synechococcales cyanobacterium T60_A2020_003]